MNQLSRQTAPAARIAAISLALSVFSLAPAQTIYVPGGNVGNITGSNVGIGTSSPTDRLQVVGGGVAAQGVLRGNADADWGSLSGEPVYGILSGRYEGIAQSLHGFGVINATGFESPFIYGYEAANNKILFGGVTTGDRNPATGFKPRMVVDLYNGNVGIGTTSPISRLQLSDTANVQLTLHPLNGANDRESIIEFWSTFDNYPGDTGSRRAGRIQSGFTGGVWGTEYMAFGVGGSSDANQNPAVERMRITGAGNVGIGTIAPLSMLHVGDGTDASSMTGVANVIRATSHSFSTGITARRDGYAEVGFRAGPYGEVGTFTNHDLHVITNGAEQIRVTASGNVGIGTTTPGTNKLSVNGTIRAKEVVIEASPWPDDVFAPGYALPTVDDVAAHIESEGHLPGVPSTTTVAEQGVALGEMQKTLLRKVEELTLYLIQQDRKLEGQAREIDSLRAELAALRTQTK